MVAEHTVNMHNMYVNLSKVTPSPLPKFGSNPVLIKFLLSKNTVGMYEKKRKYLYLLYEKENLSDIKTKNITLFRITRTKQKGTFKMEILFLRKAKKDEWKGNDMEKEGDSAYSVVGKSWKYFYLMWEPGYLTGLLFMGVPLTNFTD